MVGTTCLELVLPAVPGSVRRARRAAAEAVEGLNGDARVADAVRLCVSEAVTNVVRHAYAGPTSGDVAVVVEKVDDELNVIVRDSGVGVRRSRPAAGASGHGLKIIEKLSGESGITSRPGEGTELRMTFFLDGTRTRR